MISVLLPSGCSDYELQLAGVLKNGTVGFFDPCVVEFLDAFSKSILLDKSDRPWPEAAAVAHWMRKAHIRRLHLECENARGDRIWAPRGVALHFAPANVDSIFLYSWFLSMLAGNGNVIRLSQSRNPALALLLDKLNILVEDKQFAAIRDRTLILSYAHNDTLTRKLSESCHLRVLWGGDEAVRSLRAVPMNPRASEIVFANRFSLAVLSASEVVGLDRAQMVQLAARFCNDAYWFDQMACSSPRLVVWVGDQSSCGPAQELFWMQVKTELVNRGLTYPEVVGMNKLVTAYAAAGMGYVDEVHTEIAGPVGRVHLAKDATTEFRKMECGGGLFFETEIQGLGELISLLDERDQTVSYFGFERSDLNRLTRSLPMRAIDRIVPIGSALDFSAVWDGNNLLQSFSREIELR